MQICYIFKTRDERGGAGGEETGKGVENARRHYLIYQYR